MQSKTLLRYTQLGVMLCFEDAVKRLQFLQLNTHMPGLQNPHLEALLRHSFQIRLAQGLYLKELIAVQCAHAVASRFAHQKPTTFYFHLYYHSYRAE